MFKNRVIKSDLKTVLPELEKLAINKIKLLSTGKKITSWEEYLNDSLKQYTNSLEEFDVEIIKEKYSKFVESSDKWKFRFTKLDEIEIINWDPYKAILSTDWNDQIKYQKDLILELYEEKTFPLGRHIRFFADLYVVAQIYIEHGGPDHIMSGARPGTHETWIAKGHNEDITFDKKLNQLKIGEALFQVIS